MRITVVKIGGNVIDDTNKLSSFIARFAAIDGYKILVHGGGKIATDIGLKLGIEPDYVNGRRVTDAATLGLVTMVYGGLINKNIVAELQSHQCNAIGLTGADARVLPANKRPVKDVDYGFVGDVGSDGVNTKFIVDIMALGLTPVFAPLTYDGQGGLLNTNADTIAQEVAKALAVAGNDVQLIYCFEKKGVLLDADDDSSVIGRISAAEFILLKERKIISGGMLPKLENAFAAIDAGVQQVIIGHADELAGLLSGNTGTCIH